MNAIDPDILAIFARDISPTQTNLMPRFTPRFAAFNSLVQALYSAYSANSFNTIKVLTLGGLSYYATAIIWLKIIRIKEFNGDPLNEVEYKIRDMTWTMSFNIPEPLAHYLECFGNVTSSTGEKLYPSFPAFPTNDNHAHWGNISVANHCLYEEIPTLGLSAQLVCQEVDNAAEVGHWVPTVVPANTKPTQNLLGYFPKMNLSKEVTGNYLNCGVTDSNIGSTLPNADFNLSLLTMLSHTIGRLGVFKIEPTVFGHNPPNGHLCQLVVMKPQDIVANVSNVDGEVQTHSLSKSPSSTGGRALSFAYNIKKEGALTDNLYTSWCCISNDNGHNIVTQAWYDNRNDNRSFHIYDVNVFTTGAQNGKAFRQSIVQDFVNNW